MSLNIRIHLRNLWIDQNIMDQKAAATLWANRDFVKLWTGQTVSKFGTHITGAAMAAAAVLVLGATPAQMGLLGAFEGLPVLLISLLAGVWVDRLRRKPILIAADLGRAVILLTLPLAALFGVLSMGQLYVVAGLVGVLSVLYNVADQSFLPALVKREQLIEANARLGASDSAGRGCRTFTGRRPGAVVKCPLRHPGRCSQLLFFSGQPEPHSHR